MNICDNLFFHVNYYTTNQNNYAKQDGVKSNGDTSNSPSSKNYAAGLITTVNSVFTRRIGLINSNIWIGQLSNPTNTNSRAISGNFVDTVTIDGTSVTFLGKQL